MQRRYRVWSVPYSTACGYEPSEYYRVLQVIDDQGQPSELVVGEGCEEPGSDCLVVLKKKTPINRMNLLLWDDRVWFWIIRNR